MTEAQFLFGSFNNLHLSDVLETSRFPLLAENFKSGHRPSLSVFNFLLKYLYLSALGYREAPLTELLRDSCHLAALLARRAARCRDEDGCRLLQNGLALF